MGRIEIAAGDIAEQQVDAVVNAANNQLVLGSGVAGAIRRRGGPAIQEECDRAAPIEVGEVAVTGGGELPARYVIHAATMAPGGAATEEAISASLRRALAAAAARGCRSVAVPALGTGVGGFSVRRCAELLLREARDHLAGDTPLEEVRFVLFDEGSYRLFEAVWDGLRITEGKTP